MLDRLQGQLEAYSNINKLLDNVVYSGRLSTYNCIDILIMLKEYTTDNMSYIEAEIEDILEDMEKSVN